MTLPELPLAGIRIVDFTVVIAGPVATAKLTDMGAEVIKVESARRFDNTRNYAGLPSGEPGERPYNRRALFNIRNRSKLGITLDLTTAKGVEVFMIIQGIVGGERNGRGGFGVETAPTDPDPVEFIRPSSRLATAPMERGNRHSQCRERHPPWRA